MGHARFSLTSLNFCDTARFFVFAAAALARFACFGRLWVRFAGALVAPGALVGRPVAPGAAVAGNEGQPPFTHVAFSRERLLVLMKVDDCQVCHRGRFKVLTRTIFPLGLLITLLK